MKYTQEQLQKLANEGKLSELDEICALAQRWHKDVDTDDATCFIPNRPYWTSADGEEGEYVDDYSPTTNGGQAVGLMLKCFLHVDIDPINLTEKECTVFWHSMGGADGLSVIDSVMVQNKNPLIAITIAAILAIQSD